MVLSMSVISGDAIVAHLPTKVATVLQTLAGSRALDAKEITRSAKYLPHQLFPVHIGHAEQYIPR